MKRKVVITMHLVCLVFLAAFTSCAGKTAEQRDDSENIDQSDSETITDNNAASAEDPMEIPVVTLKELFDNRQKYDGKIVSVKGECVKINENIMGMNWVHLQDQSAPERKLDLTITTSDSPVVGASIKATGKIALDKDIGSGYQFDVIMEDARIE